MESVACSETQKQRDILADTASRRPEVGDYWSEHFVPIAHIVEVTTIEVTYATPIPHPGDPSYLCFDYYHLEVKGRNEFFEWLHYSPTSKVADKTWCGVKRGVLLKDIPPKEEWRYKDPNRMTFRSLKEEATKFGYTLVKNEVGVKSD